MAIPFTGSYDASVDAKHRTTLPAPLRHRLEIKDGQENELYLMADREEQRIIGLPSRMVSHLPEPPPLETLLRDLDRLSRWRRLYEKLILVPVSSEGRLVMPVELLRQVDWPRNRRLPIRFVGAGHVFFIERVHPREPETVMEETG